MLKLFGRKWILTMCLVALGSGLGHAQEPQSQSLPPEDIAYLRELARDTWNGMDYFRAPATGFPYDSNFRPETTNTTNVGLYLISVVAAERMKFITPAQARERVTQILDSLKSIEHCNGFFSNHLEVNGKTKATSGISAVSDFNKLAAALLVLRQAYPDLKTAGELFDRIQWSWLWNQPDSLYLAYDVSNRQRYSWGHGWFASDQRMAVFLGVAAGGLPTKAYYEMERRKAKQYGLEFFLPAWNYAGLFMHAMCGLIKDERFEEEMGLSTANFAYAQILFARNHQYPAWGWSACNIPGVGYTIDGHLSQAVVTPHASALVISYYPQKVVANFRRLEQLGCRPKFEENGQTFAFGFRDSINLVTGEVSSYYYTGLDQAMLFIALANFLEEGCIWRLYMQDPVVKHGVEVLNLSPRFKEERQRLFAERDAHDFLALASASPTAAKPLIIDSGGDAQRNDLNLERSIKIHNLWDGMMKQTQTQAGGQGGVIALEYDFQGMQKGKAMLVEPLNSLDATGYNAVAFKCRGESQEKSQTMNLRLEVADDLESKNTAFVEDIGPEWNDYVFPFEAFRGIVADISNLQRLEFSLDMAPDFMPANRVNVGRGTLYLDDIRLVYLPPEQLRACLQDLKRNNELFVGNQGVLEGMERLSGWQTFKDSTAEFTLQTEKKPTRLLKVEYSLGTLGKWVGWDKTCLEDLSKDFTLFFEFKPRGSDNVLEVKLFSTEGGVFGKRIAFNGNQTGYRKVALEKKDIERLWGGRPSDRLAQIEQFGFAISGNSNTRGSVEIRNLRLIKK